jgi:xanthine dehydrogenase small subunit
MTGARAAIHFLLDGQLQALSGFDPTTTVLEYLRESLGRKGPKEGCAEGDCGACMVLIAELYDGGRVRARPVNA